MSAKSHRQRILEAVACLLESAVPGLRVRRGLGRLDDNDLKSLPLVSILESPKPEEIESPSHGPTRQTDWVLYLTGYVEWSPRHPTDAPHELLACVKQALSAIRNERSADYLLGGQLNLVGALVGGGICRPPDDAHPASYFLLPLTITFVENLEAP